MKNILKKNIILRIIGTVIVLTLLIIIVGIKYGSATTAPKCGAEKKEFRSQDTIGESSIDVSMTVDGNTKSIEETTVALEETTAMEAMVAQEGSTVEEKTTGKLVEETVKETTDGKQEETTIRDTTSSQKNTTSKQTTIVQETTKRATTEQKTTKQETTTKQEETTKPLRGVNGVIIEELCLNLKTGLVSLPKTKDELVEFCGVGPASAGKSYDYLSGSIASLCLFNNEIKFYDGHTGSTVDNVKAIYGTPYYEYTDEEYDTKCVMYKYLNYTNDASQVIYIRFEFGGSIGYNLGGITIGSYSDLDID